MSMIDRWKATELMMQARMEAQRLARATLEAWLKPELDAMQAWVEQLMEVQNGVPQGLPPGRVAPSDSDGRRGVYPQDTIAAAKEK